jgi:hypothetical protein
MIRLRDRMREDLELRGFRANTIDIYLRCARRFVDYFNLPPSKLGAAEVRRFGLHLLREAGVSASTVSVYAAAIRFLYCVTLKRPEVVTVGAREDTDAPSSGAERRGSRASARGPPDRKIPCHGHARVRRGVARR